MSTKITQRLDEQRNSPEMRVFKEKVNAMLEFANDPKIEYYLIRDLAKKINLPFYKETSGRGRRTKMSSDTIIKGYCKLFCDYYKTHSDDNFIEELFMHLSEQQNQHLRKLSRRTSCQNRKSATIKMESKNGVWEHPIPLKYSRDILIDYIKCDNQHKINAYIDFIWTHTYQVFLVDKWDRKLNAFGLRDTMPTGWNWEDPSNNNVFQRYIEVGIPKEEYC